MNGYNSTSSGANPDQRAAESSHDQASSDGSSKTETDRPREFGGRRNGLEPTRYGDWEKDGRCIDF
ncbi:MULTISPECIES: DUF1674 domain-containing protein [unclassified Wenzhouxiangella]|uniref:DUF1674 domain-containing protein n=1 Tax=unclassified Wenzhouxiangella TaxID=2613841 RepID=UPI000E3251ED|nr:MULTISPECIES: DUF1674 domain-containing protein [unclassified Wenzhouxiangella]RFF28226.1 DUF1674 domain-containing protein [Wenzhouxiangella sp. 15181]RFP67901.1 DUF1674 domain-containing protein [Wenzhouxiangella sp. 15190]